MSCNHDERDTLHLATFPKPIALSTEPWAQEWNRQAQAEWPKEGMSLHDITTTSWPNICKKCGDGLPDDTRRRYFDTPEDGAS